MEKTIELVSMTFKNNDGQEITITFDSRGETGAKVKFNTQDPISMATVMAGIIAGVGCEQVRKIFGDKVIS